MMGAESKGPGTRLVVLGFLYVDVWRAFYAEYGKLF